ncbi:MAG: hypothetical protein AAF492_15385 [Verrucomicrobiota bacterium]
MHLLNINACGQNHTFAWPGDHIETFPHWVEYQAMIGEHPALFRIGFGTRPVYGKNRIRVVVWINGTPHVEFLGADDFEKTGEILSEIRVPGMKAERMCNYNKETVPERYMGMTVAGLKTRVSGPRVHNAWAIIVNLADHKRICLLAALRKIERERER